MGRVSPSPRRPTPAQLEVPRGRARRARGRAVLRLRLRPRRVPARRSPSGAFVLAAFAPRAVFFFGSRSEAMSAASVSGRGSRVAIRPPLARRPRTTPRRNLADAEPADALAVVVRGPVRRAKHGGGHLGVRAEVRANESHGRRGELPRPGVPAESSSARRRDAPGDPRRFSPSGTSAGIAQHPARETQSTTNPTPKMPSGSFSGRRGSREASICAAVSHASPSAIPVGGALSDQPRAKRSDDGRRYVGGIEHRVTFAPIERPNFGICPGKRDRGRIDGS